MFAQRTLCLPGRGLPIALGVLFVLLAAPAAEATPPTFKGASANGGIVYFESEEQLVPGDTDTRRDVYERSWDEGVDAFVTRQVSLGPTGGNDAYTAQFEGVSEDGERVFFSTDEGLVEADTDRQKDIYLRDLETATTTLVSVGDADCESCGNGALGVRFAAVDNGGEEVFFTSDKSLTAADTDKVADLYVRHIPDPADPLAEETELVSTPAASCPGCGNGESAVSWLGISADGNYAYFSTGEQLSAADGDSEGDIYAHDLGTSATTLVSAGECTSSCDGSKPPVFGGSSTNGEWVFFTTEEKLVDGDDDGATDVYGRDLLAGATELVSGDGGDFSAEFEAASDDGSRVLFSTTEPIDGTDLDGTASDVYEWSGGSPTLVTPGTCSGPCAAADFDAVSDDFTHLVFSTVERLDTLNDTDSRKDVYRQSVAGGPPELLSVAAAGCSGCGSGDKDATFNRASADTAQVAFTTDEVLRADDKDGERDIYARDLSTSPTGTTSLITTSPSYCPLKPGNCGATFAGASSDGRHFYFSSVERFTVEDGNEEVDVYERFLADPPAGDETRLISVGNAPALDLGPPPPVLESTDPLSPGNSTTPRIIGDAEDGSLIKIYTTAECDGEPVATGTEAQLASPGLKVTVAARSLTTFRATAEADGFVSDCSAPISYLEDSEAPPGGGSGGSGGSGGGGGGSPGGGIFRPASGGTVTTTVTTSKPAAGIAYVTPRTRITFGPAAKTRSRSPVFRFTDSTGQPGTRFQCKLDRRRWRACSSPLRLKRLRRGRHVLKVLATNAAGTVEQASVRRAFKVVPR
jgi:hypothetical protein